MRAALQALFIGIGSITYVAGFLSAAYVLPIEYRGPLFQVAASAFALAIVTARPIRTVAS